MSKLEANVGQSYWVAGGMWSLCSWDLLLFDFRPELLDLFAHKYWVAGGGVGPVLNRFATLAPLPFEARLCNHITAQIV